MIIRAAAETRHRIRLLFAGVVVVFFTQFIGGKVWREPYPGLFAPAFDEGRSRKANRPCPRLRAHFKDGTKEKIPWKDFVGGIYYKQRGSVKQAFLKHLKEDRPKSTSQVVAWLVEKYSDTAPERTLVKLLWTDVNKDGSKVKTTIWCKDPNCD